MSRLLLASELHRVGVAFPGVRNFYLLTRISLLPCFYPAFTLDTEARGLLPFYANLVQLHTFTVLRQNALTFTLPPPYAELLWVGVASEPLALRSVGDGVSALQRCVTGCSRAQRCPAHMLKDMDPITGQMQSSQRHSRLARRLQYAEARRVSSRNGL